MLMQRRLLLQRRPGGGRALRGGHRGGGGARGRRGVGRHLVFAESAVQRIQVLLLSLERPLLSIFVDVLSPLAVRVALRLGVQRPLLPLVFDVAPVVAVHGSGVFAVPHRGALFAVADGGVAGVVGVVLVVELGDPQGVALLGDELLAELRAASTQVARRGVTAVDRVRAHACKHSERGGRDKSTTDVTARRSHRPEQEEGRRGGGGGGGVGEEVQRPTYRTVNAYCLENTDDWCAGSTLSLSRYR
ncbi:hypothetical protein EYF80_030743 [Liparis tanakae]|uniref:Uncharacterized protein n=1 Tax=Liparis tanakae TaxID=230148 RepID=A0A4Z2H0Y3_9TELE|nr:hypothetical protein EYF80_030743 [Liparis tanakae]